MRFYEGLLCNDVKIKCICAADSTALGETRGREGGRHHISEPSLNATSPR